MKHYSKTFLIATHAPIYLFFDMVIPWTSWSSLGLKKDPYHVIHCDITHSSRKLITIFLTPVLEVFWITHQVLIILWLNLGALWHWHHQAETAKI